MVDAPLASEVSNSLHYGLKNLYFIGFGTGIVPVCSAFLGILSQHQKHPHISRNVMMYLKGERNLVDLLLGISNLRKQQLNIVNNFQIETSADRAESAVFFYKKLLPFCLQCGDVVHVFFCSAQENIRQYLRDAVNDINQSTNIRVELHCEVFDK